MICRKRLCSRSWLGERCARSLPRKNAWPLVGSVSRRRARPRVDLPQPDSPTSPRVSPGKMSSETPSTALTIRLTGDPPVHLSNHVPPPKSKWTLKSRSSISGARRVGVALPPGALSVVEVFIEHRWPAVVDLPAGCWTLCAPPHRPVRQNGRAKNVQG